MWGKWSTCSASCGQGLTHRRRTCTNPRPSYNGNYCFDDPTEYAQCIIKQCPGTRIVANYINQRLSFSKDSICEKKTFAHADRDDELCNKCLVDIEGILLPQCLNLHTFSLEQSKCFGDICLFERSFN